MILFHLIDKIIILGMSVGVWRALVNYSFPALRGLIQLYVRLLLWELLCASFSLSLPHLKTLCLESWHSWIGAVCTDRDEAGCELLKHRCAKKCVLGDQGEQQSCWRLHLTISSIYRENTQWKYSALSVHRGIPFRISPHFFLTRWNLIVCNGGELQGHLQVIIVGVGGSL